MAIAIGSKVRVKNPIYREEFRMEVGEVVGKRDPHTLMGWYNPLPLYRIHFPGKNDMEFSEAELLEL